MQGDGLEVQDSQEVNPQHRCEDLQRVWEM